MYNQTWTIQRTWQYIVHKTKKNKTYRQHNICLIPLCVSKHNKRKKDMSPPTNNWR